LIPGPVYGRILALAAAEFGSGTPLDEIDPERFARLVALFLPAPEPF
jgi:hypothetical protein